MRNSIATVCLSGGLGEKLDAIAAAGFHGIEIFENDLLSFDGSPREVGDAVRNLGLSIVALQPFRDFEGMPGPERQRVMDRAERKFDLMHELGTDLLLVCSNVSPASLGGVQRAADDFRELGERAARRGLRVGFEALSWGRHISDYRDSWEVVRRADHPAIGLVLDTFHILARRSDLGAIESIPPDRIFLVQVADAPELTLDPLTWSRHFRSFPGQGALPLGRFMDSLRATGYDGVLSLEVFNDSFRAAPPRETAVDGHRSLIYLADGERRRQGAEPPPPAGPLGVEFIEFAVDETTGGDLARLLDGMGFVRAGLHRSKRVELWRQGGVNIVLNAEKEGFAHSYLLVHGPSVCAIGLREPDARARLARAEKLLCRAYRQPVGPGEATIPAIRGVEGSLVYLVDAPAGAGPSNWELDFDLEAGGDAGDGALLGVDHLSYSLPPTAFQSCVLFFRAVFDLEPRTAEDIVDPGGLVRSQALENAGPTVRVALNSSDSPATQAGRFLNELFGAGVQHVAFETADIFAFVRRAEERGVRLLRIPANYYLDLAARFGLDDGFVDRLRDHNVLYDRDDAGEYLQAYTASFADRFFFEVVERRGYRGYGAANAAIRLAAQSREARSAAGGAPALR